MNPAARSTIDVQAGRFLLRATGSRPVFDGFTRLYEERIEGEGGSGNGNGNGGAEGVSLPAVAPGEALRYRSSEKEQHFTEPPPRYTEASLVKALEEKGIGRPSTYATIVSTILTRDYVNRDKGKLAPTDLGQTVTRLLLEVFPDIFEVDFTARMEGSSTDRNGEDAVRSYAPSEPFDGDLKSGFTSRAKRSSERRPGRERPGLRAVRRQARKEVRAQRAFLACPNYPTCKFTKPLKEEEIPVPTRSAERQPRYSCAPAALRLVHL
jgi:DNA topoisomerase-1